MDSYGFPWIPMDSSSSSFSSFSLSFVRCVFGSSVFESSRAAATFSQAPPSRRGPSLPAEFHKPAEFHMCAREEAAVDAVQPPTKRAKLAPKLIVTKEHGLELLLGTYMQTGDCSGYPYYEKQDGGEGPCFLYYWKGDEPARAAGRFVLSNESPACRVSQALRVSHALPRCSH